MKSSLCTIMKTPVFGLLVLTVLLTGACSSKIIRGASPMVRINELSHEHESIALQLSIRNLNGVELDIQTIDLTLKLDDKASLAYQGPARTNIVANSTERWSVEIEESPASRELLNTLQNGGVKNLPYSLKGKIATLDDGTLRFEYEGRIYPLPGKPGHFR